MTRTAHYPGRARIDAYGAGGFRFADMSHRGSILALPSGIRAWNQPPDAPLDEAALAAVLAEAAEIDFLVLGTGERPRPVAPSLRFALQGAGIALEVTGTGAAARTYNILLGEGRRVAAALVAVEARP